MFRQALHSVHVCMSACMYVYRLFMCLCIHNIELNYEDLGFLCEITLWLTH